MSKRYRRDQTMIFEWDAYCQALRDVPVQVGFPWNIVCEGKLSIDRETSTAIIEVNNE
jgi:hypothetical protein